MFYIIKSGKVRITKLESKNNNEAFIASLGVGDIFGEMAILNDKPRNASAVAETETLLMIIRKDGINKLPPSMFVKILILLTRRIWLAQKQLQCTLTDNPSLKCYIYIIAKINLAGMNEENDYNLRSCFYNSFNRFRNFICCLPSWMCVKNMTRLRKV